MFFDFPPECNMDNPTVYDSVAYGYYMDNRVAYGYTREESVPYPAYPAGTRDKENPVYAHPAKDKNEPLLLIEEDIVNSEGFGLKKGFYQTQLDETGDFLLLFQSGRLKAKAPVVSIEQRKQNPPTKSTPKKVKREKKNYKGTDPKDFVYQSAELFYDAQQGCYIIIWNRANTRVKAFLK